ncbi:MAG: hypothetical protein NTY19_19275 [Planctomycetota bacterium]|nr:hypothetical protein [Planctomycetota bacterium]
MIGPLFADGLIVDLSDEMATKVDIQFYLDAREASLKEIQE